MPRSRGKTPTRQEREALAAFQGSLQRAIAGVTPAVLTLRSGNLTLQGEPVSLGRDRAFGLAASLFVVVEPTSEERRIRIRTVGYAYGLHDRALREFLVYHWHPSGPSPVVWPHAHLGVGLVRPERAHPFVGSHLPTGPVTVTAVLRAAVDDLGVAPPRDDWRERLAEADAALPASLG